MKTKGYHFEHHFGHGQQHLSSLLASLIIPDFLTYTVLGWMDDKYRLLRQKLPSRQRLFNGLRTLTSYRCFQSWEALMDFCWRASSRKPGEVAKMRIAARLRGRANVPRFWLLPGDWNPYAASASL